MKYEIGGAAIEEFVALQPKICSCMVDDNSKDKKSKKREQKMLLQVITNIKMSC